MDSIESIRKRIDEIDQHLTILLNERATLAQNIGKIKSKLGLDAYSPEREEEIMDNVTSKNSGPLSKSALRRLFERIIDESRSVERSAMEKQTNSSDSSK